MYENFLISDHGALYLLLEENAGIISALRFSANIHKYGYPNDEALGSHPLMQYGLGVYGFFEVKNSPWINELKTANRIHSRHSDSMYNGLKHYIATFKDEVFEVIARSFEEIELSSEEVLKLVTQSISYLRD